MIDLHSHVLPGIDDGAATLSEAIELAAASEADGTRVLAATPHVHAAHPRVRPSELAGRVAELRAALAAHGLGVEIVAGGEVDLAWALQADDADLRLASFCQAGHDVLIETPYGQLPAGFEDLLFRIVARGYRIVLAHPERSPTFQRDPARLGALVRQGTLLQVTAAAVGTTQRGSRSGDLARALVRDGLAHVIASDRHGPDLDRPGLSAALSTATELAGARAAWMVNDAPAAILAGDPLPPPPAAPARRRRWRRRG